MASGAAGVGRAAVLAVLAVGIGGCAGGVRVPNPMGGKPAYSAAVDQALGAAKTDMAALYAGLQTAPPACTGAANADQFAKVLADLDQAARAAKAVAHDDRTVAGVADLRQSTTTLQTLAAGRPDCLPPAVVQDTAKVVALNLGELIKYEQAKGR